MEGGNLRTILAFKFVEVRMLKLGLTIRSPTNLNVLILGLLDRLSISFCG